MEDLVRVGSPDHRAVEVDGLSGRRYHAHDGGMYDMLPRDAAALVHEGGFRPGIGPGAWARGGHVCPRGHHNYLPTCGRCSDHELQESLLKSGFGPLDPRADGQPLAIYGFDDIDDRGRMVYPDPDPGVEW